MVGAPTCEAHVTVSVRRLLRYLIRCDGWVREDSARFSRVAFDMAERNDWITCARVDGVPLAANITKLGIAALRWGGASVSAA